MLDELDSDIIEALQHNGRESFRSMAARLGVAEATVRSRVAKLTTARVLDIVGVTNPFALGFDVMATIAVSARTPQAAAHELARWSEVTHVVQVTGRFDLLCEVACSDREQFRDLLAKVRAVDGVTDTESFTYLDIVKQHYAWGLPRSADGADEASSTQAG